MAYTGTEARSGAGAVILIGLKTNVSPQSYTEIGEVRSADLHDARRDVNDVTNYDSGNTKEFNGGCRDNGIITLTLNRVSTEVGQQALDAAWKDGALYSFAELLPPTADQPGWVLKFNALVVSRNYDLDPHKCIAPQIDLKISGEYAETVLAAGTAVPCTNATAHLACTSSGPLSAAHPIVSWSNFALKFGSGLPEDAVVQGIYPVMVASANFDEAQSFYDYTRPGSGFTYFTQPSSPSNVSFSSTLFYAPSISSLLSAALAAYTLTVQQLCTLVAPVLTDTIDVTAVGLAIYYTSRAPIVDPQIAPPFAVPAGQGIAWALPTAVTQTGDSGHFVGYGTAAIF